MFSGHGLDVMSICMPLANAWIQRWFKECIYTPWEMVGFCIGLSSVMFWIVAQVPQFVTNFSRQSADALSPWFLVQWLVGDSCNFIGCLLTGDQLVTETITAAYFILSDLIILFQYLYYGCKGHRKHLGGYGSDSDESLHKPPNGYYEALQNGTASQLDQILKDSTTDRVKSPKRHMLNSGKHSENADSHVKKSRAKVAFCFTGLLTLGTWGWHSFLGDPNFERNGVPNGNTVIALGRRSLKEVRQEDQSFPRGQRGSAPLWTRDIGRLLGWISSVLYLSSRVSQLLKNRSRKSTEGLSLGMVGCAILGNLTYGLSILMLIKSWGDLFGKAPWLVGSLGTVSLDLTMFIQAYYFRYRHGEITMDECNPLLA